MQLRKSAARPRASRAMVRAVAGARTRRSARWVASMWPMRWLYSSDHMSSNTPWRDSVSNVSGATNLVAASVMTTCTSAPAFVSSRSNSTALYAAMLPVTPSRMRLPLRLMSRFPRRLVSATVSCVAPEENAYRLLGLDADDIRHGLALDGEQAEDLGGQLCAMLGQHIVVGLSLGDDQRRGTYRLAELGGSLFPRDAQGVGTRLDQPIHGAVQTDGAAVLHRGVGGDGAPAENGGDAAVVAPHLADQ